MQLITVKEAAQRIPGRNGKPVHPNTVRKWMKKGHKGHLLKAIKCGNDWKTSDEWIKEFQIACTGTTQTIQIQLGNETAKQRLHRRFFNRGNKGKVHH